MYKVCYLLTTEFPYGRGEVFLQRELPILARKFERIYIFSIYGNENSGLQGELPENVFLCPLEIKNTRCKYIKYTIAGMLANKKGVTIENGVKRKIISFYSIGRTNEIVSKIMRIINRSDIPKSDVLIYSYWFNYLAMSAWRLKELLSKEYHNIKVISRAHRYDLYHYCNRANFLPFQKENIENLNAVYTCSRNGEVYLLEKYPLCKNKISTSCLGTEDYGTTIATKDENFCIATCSNLTPVKRVDLLLEAMAILDSNVKKGTITWICIGDGPMRNSLEEGANRVHNINIEFKGYMPNDEVLRLYKNKYIDLFVNTSESEGLPVSIMEVISFGIPVIATNVGGTSEIVVDGLTGSLVDKEITPDELANVILGFINGSTIKRECVRKVWEENFNADLNFNKFSDDIMIDNDSISMETDC